MATTSKSRPKLKRLGKYSILGRLGSGGMSRVYRAIADGSNTAVALKATPMENDVDVEMVDYQREVMVGRRVKHPRCITAIDHGCRDGYMYLAMPIVEGATLSKTTRLRDPSRKPSSTRSSAWSHAWAVPMLEAQWGHLAVIGYQMADALVACHAGGVIHRDLKPANIMMNRNGDTFLMDFGLAWLRRGVKGHELATKAGTARYLPPEVFDKQRDERSDIYSLGITMQELTTGLKPWGDVEHEVILETRPDYRVQLVRDIRKDVPEILANCIDKASADDPDQRYPDAASMAADFRNAAVELKADHHSLQNWDSWVTANASSATVASAVQSQDQVMASVTQSFDTMNEMLTKEVWFGDA